MGTEKSTVSSLHFWMPFPDQGAAIRFLESHLWPSGPKCPRCSSTERVSARKGGFYRCNPCKLDFTVRTGTIFERSHVPLHKWLYAMHILSNSGRISSSQLAKEIEITQKSAWFVLRRLRSTSEYESLRRAIGGIRQVDVTSFSEEPRNPKVVLRQRPEKSQVAKSKGKRLPPKASANRFGIRHRVAP